MEQTQGQQIQKHTQGSQGKKKQVGKEEKLKRIKANNKREIKLNMICVGVAQLNYKHHIYSSKDKRTIWNVSCFIHVHLKSGNI